MDEQVPVRYSQMSEEEAAQKFEMRYKCQKNNYPFLRKQMLMNDLMKQHSNRKSSEKPPRHSQSKQKLPTQQNEFIVYKQSEEKVKPQKKIESPMKQTSSSENLYGMTQSNEKQSRGNKNSNNGNSSGKKSSQKSLKQTENTYQMTNYTSNQSQGQSQSCIFNETKKQPMKDALLSEIGFLDLEIKRMMSEQKEVEVDAKKFKNKEQNPYFEIRKKLGDPLNQSERKEDKTPIPPVENTVKIQSDKKQKIPLKGSYVGLSNKKAILRKDSPGKSANSFFNQANQTQRSQIRTNNFIQNSADKINISKSTINKSQSQIDENSKIIKHHSLKSLAPFDGSARKKISESSNEKQ